MHRSRSPPFNRDFPRLNFIIRDLCSNISLNVFFFLGNWISDMFFFWGGYFHLQNSHQEIIMDSMSDWWPFPFLSEGKPRGAPANPLWLQICKNTLNAPLLRVPEFPPEEYIRIMKNLNKVGSSFYFYGFQGKLRAVNLGLPFEIIPWETFMIKKHQKSVDFH